MFLFGRVGEVVWRNNEVGLDGVLRQIMMPVISIAVLNFIVAIEVHQCLRGDVDTARDSCTLHDIGESDIIGPHIELPLPQTQHSTVDPDRVEGW